MRILSGAPILTKKDKMTNNKKHTLYQILALISSIALNISFVLDGTILINWISALALGLFLILDHLVTRSELKAYEKLFKEPHAGFLGLKMAYPLWVRPNYTDLASKMFPIEPLPDRANIIYNESEEK